MGRGNYSGHGWGSGIPESLAGNTAVNETLRSADLACERKNFSHFPAISRMCRPSARDKTAMRPFATLLWTLVC